MKNNSKLSNLQLSDIIDHIRNRPYMSGIERDRARIKATHEVFTPTEAVQEMFDRYLDDKDFTNPELTFLDNSAGDGQILGEVLIRKVQNGIDFETALSAIYGVEKEADNCELLKTRLLCGQEHLRYIVDTNIVCADALKYHYRFDGTPPDKTNQDLILDKFIEEK
jgi:hypothetical protein